jgi:hypothetical protein
MGLFCVFNLRVLFGGEKSLVYLLLGLCQCCKIYRGEKCKNSKFGDWEIHSFYLLVLCKKIVSTNVRKKNQCANTMAGLTEKSVMIGVENG